MSPKVPRGSQRWRSGDSKIPSSSKTARDPLSPSWGPVQGLDTCCRDLVTELTENSPALWFLLFTPRSLVPQAIFCLSQPHIPGLGLLPVSYNRTFSIQELTDVQQPVHRSCELPLYFCWHEALRAIYWLVQNNRCWLKKQCETHHSAVGGLVHRNYKYFWSHPPSPFLLNFAKFPLHTGLSHFHNVTFYYFFSHSHCSCSVLGWLWTLKSSSKWSKFCLPPEMGLQNYRFYWIHSNSKPEKWSWPWFYLFQPQCSLVPWKFSLFSHAKQGNFQCCCSVLKSSPIWRPSSVRACPQIPPFLSITGKNICPKSPPAARQPPNTGNFW